MLISPHENLTWSKYIDLLYSSPSSKTLHEANYPVYSQVDLLLKNVVLEKACNHTRNHNRYLSYWKDERICL